MTRHAIEREHRRDLAARRAAVRENRARGLSANLDDALRFMRDAERGHAVITTPCPPAGG